MQEGQFPHRWASVFADCDSDTRVKLRFLHFKCNTSVRPQVAECIPLFLDAHCSAFAEANKMKLSVGFTDTSLEAITKLFSRVLKVRQMAKPGWWEWEPEGVIKPDGSAADFETLLNLISLLQYLKFPCNESGFPLCLYERIEHRTDTYEEVPLVGDEFYLTWERMTDYERNDRLLASKWDKKFYFDNFMIHNKWDRSDKDPIGKGKYRRYLLTRVKDEIECRVPESINSLLSYFSPVPIEELYAILERKFHTFSTDFQHGIVQSYCQHCFGWRHQSAYELFSKWDTFTYNWPWLAKYIFGDGMSREMLHDLGTPIKRMARIIKCKTLEEVLDYLWQRVYEEGHDPYELHLRRVAAFSGTVEDAARLAQYKNQRKRKENQERIKIGMQYAAMGSGNDTRDRYIALGKLYLAKK
jgi:hypothetical protein